MGELLDLVGFKRGKESEKFAEKEDIEEVKKTDRDVKEAVERYADTKQKWKEVDFEGAIFEEDLQDDLNEDESVKGSEEIAEKSLESLEKSEKDLANFDSKKAS